ncbi:MAG: hypothetical protein R3C53_09900 [Pirellulaceae bacterium]
MPGTHTFFGWFPNTATTNSFCYDNLDLSDNDKIVSFDYTVRSDGRRTDVDDFCTT